MLEERQRETIEIDTHGRVYLHTTTAIYKDGELLIENERRGRETKRLTPDRNFDDLPPMARKLFDAVFDDDGIDAYYDERVGQVQRDTGNPEAVGKINQRRAAAKAARQQRQRQKQNRP